MKKLMVSIAVLLSTFFMSPFAVANASGSLLFVIHAADGQIQETVHHDYVLQLTPRNQQILFFVSRPSHTTGSITIQKFLTLWNNKTPDNFSQSNPNAALVATTDRKYYYHNMIVLGTPQYNAKTKMLSFPIKTLSANTPIEPFQTADLTLFIDNIKQPREFSSGFVAAA